MAVFEKPRLTADDQVCRGKAGRSKPHAHYRGHRETTVQLDGQPTLVSRCTSCGSVLVWALDRASGRALTTSPAALAPERMEELGRAMVAAL